MSILELLAGSTTGCAASALLTQVTQISLRACQATIKFAVFRRDLYGFLAESFELVTLYRNLFIFPFFERVSL